MEGKYVLREKVIGAEFLWPDAENKTFTGPHPFFIQ